MYVLFLLAGMACALLGLFYIRLCLEIRSLHNQLGEIARGSHLELTVASRQRALTALCRRLNQVLASKDTSHIQYEKAERQLKQNITNLAHDIRTPLTGAAGYVQLAEECDNPEKREHYLHAAANRLTELEDMLEKLFLYTKLTNEDFMLPGDQMKKIQVLPLLSDCLLSFYSQFEERGISPEIAFSQESFRVWAEEDALRRIFLNLIQNALIHGEGGLTVSLGQEGLSHETPPASTGALTPVLIFENPVPEDSPIAPDQIFDRFYKADPARGKSSSGLGLFIVRELMRKMGGEAKARLNGRLLRIILIFPAPPEPL